MRKTNDSVVGAIGSGENIAISPDNAYAYASNQFQGGIYVTSLTTFKQTATISSVGTPDELFVDNTGQYLFSDEGGNTQIYSTGRVIMPEPSGIILIGAIALGSLSVRGRKLKNKN